MCACVCDIKFSVCGCLRGCTALIAGIKRITVYLFRFPCVRLPNLRLLGYVHICMSVTAAFVYLTNAAMCARYATAVYDVFDRRNVYWINSLCLCEEAQSPEPRLQIIETRCSLLCLQGWLVKTPSYCCNPRPRPLLRNNLTPHLFLYILACDPHT